MRSLQVAVVPRVLRNPCTPARQAANCCNFKQLPGCSQIAWEGWQSNYGWSEPGERQHPTASAGSCPTLHYTI